MHLVWFKRDLRAADHWPLVHATERGPVLPLYVIEPELWRQPDASARQWGFLRESLVALRERLAELGMPLIVRTGSVIGVLEALHAQQGIETLWSHEETGNHWTFERDRAVGAWARRRSIPWRELPQFGVVRGLRGRDGWAKQWDAFMRRTRPMEPRAREALPGLDAGVIPASPAPHLARVACPGRQAGGRQAGLMLLESFLAGRGAAYHMELSSPLTAAESCSRLSPHLAAGTLSVREVAQACWSKAAELRQLPRAERGTQLAALRAFVGRLHWHCHFIQKLESAPRIEFENVHRGCDGLREDHCDVARFEVWSQGLTGFPFVDACMRWLRATGWINFRMRAMLMAFASYHLWLHWRETGLHLARLFTDYEPGIHWNQVQMQSGTTGINAVRIYNPVKQSMDQDPHGAFIRHWVPELQHVHGAHIHQPWTLTEREQGAARCRIGSDYPARIVDHTVAARAARERMRVLRRSEDFQREARAIQERHGSRKSGLRQSRPRPVPRPSHPGQIAFGFEAADDQTQG